MQQKPDKSTTCVIHTHAANTKYGNPLHLVLNLAYILQHFLTRLPQSTGTHFPPITGFWFSRSNARNTISSLDEYRANHFLYPNRNTGGRSHCGQCESHPAKPYTHQFTSLSPWLLVRTGQYDTLWRHHSAKKHQYAAVAVNETSTRSGSSSCTVNVHSKACRVWHVCTCMQTCEQVLWYRSRLSALPRPITYA